MASPDLAIPYQRVQNGEEAYRAAKEEITPEYIAHLNFPVTIDYRPEEKLICASGKGVTLALQFGRRETRVTLELGLLYRPFRQKVLRAIEDKLKQAL